jgi:uncharacterized protein YjbI with pentapeptide repeats
VAKPEHLELLRQGVEVWNKWRSKSPSVRPDLFEADLSEVNLSGADLSEAILGRANLSGADLSRADLNGATLIRATLARANLKGANLSGAKLNGAIFIGANLSRANLSGATLNYATLGSADLSGANLRGASLSGANLEYANLCGADLTQAYLSQAVFVKTNLTDAVLTGCNIWGVSAWGVKLSEGTKQRGLIISAPNEPEITVDDLEVAQFVYLLLHNEKIRHVIDTVTSKVVLILGRFTPERKAVLDAIRKELRNRHYVPILFDFDVPAGRDITETVSLLARMARFIIADLTEPSSIPKELEAIVPYLAAPVQPLLEGERPYAMFKDYWKYDWVLPVHRYDGLNSLLTTLADKVITPAETKTNELAEKRRLFEAELTKPQ